MPYANRLNLRVVDSSQVQNVSHARNVGADCAVTDYLLICDADDFVCAGWVHALYAALSTYPDAYILGQYHPVLDSGNLSLEHPEVQEIFSAPKWQDLIVQEPNDGEPIHTHFFVGGASFGIRKSRLLALGGFDSSYQRGSDDWDIFARARQAGMRQVSSYGAAIAYRLSSSPRQQFARNRLYGKNDVLVQMRFPGWVPPIRTAEQCLLILAKTPYRLVRYRDAESRTKIYSEAGYALGFFQGFRRYRLLRRAPKPYFPAPADTFTKQKPEGK